MALSVPVPAGGRRLRVLAGRVRLGGPAAEQDLGDPALDRRVLTQERRPDAGAVDVDPLAGRHHHTTPVGCSRDVHPLGRYAGPRGPPRRAARGNPAHAGGQARRADLALGPSQGPNGRAELFHGARRRPHGRASAAGRSRDRLRGRRSGRGERLRGRARRVACRAHRRPTSGSPRGAADGRRRGERGDRQRAQTTSS